MHVYLIGYRGSGKSTVARLLASAIQWPMVDTDEIIETTSNQSIRDIFAAEGEAGFRDREEAVIHEIASRTSPTVVATGGGAILRAGNRQRMEESGLRIWLQASAEFLYRRICGDQSTDARRPNLSDQGGFSEVAEILAARRPLYEQLAQKTVDTEHKTPDEVVAELLDWVKSKV